MALTNFQTFIDNLSNPQEFVPISVPTFTTVAGRVYDLWTTQVPVGVAPTTAVVPTSATAGALLFQNALAGNNLGVMSARFNAASPGVYIVADRLSHQGGMNATSTGVQTTNLPTAALTRYTTGAGVMLGISIYTQIGATATTITCSYTNDAGTAGRTSPLIVFGSSQFREAGRMLLVPLQSGDTGVRSVQNSTIAASTTTAGAFGYTLFKPLYAVIVDEQHAVAVIDLISGRSGGGLPEIEDDACLFVMCVSQSTNAQGVGGLMLSEW